MAGETGPEAVHVSSTQAGAGIVGLDDSELLALEALGRERACASLAGVVARHADAACSHEEVEVAHASAVCLSDCVGSTSEARSAETVLAGRAGDVAGVAVSVESVHVETGIAGADVLGQENSVRFACEAPGVEFGGASGARGVASHTLSVSGEEAHGAVASS